MMTIRQIHLRRTTVAVLLVFSCLSTIIFSAASGSPFYRPRRSYPVTLSASNGAADDDEEVSIGTTLVAVAYQGGVVVGADSRSSVGQLVSHRHANKIVPIYSSTSVVARSGSAAETQQLVQELQAQAQHRYYRYGGIRLTVSQIAHWIRNEIYQDDDSYNRVSILVAGYNLQQDDYSSSPAAVAASIYTISSSGALLAADTYAAAGSGSTYILGYLDEECRKRVLLTKEEAKALVTSAIQLAIDRDGNSGGIIRIFCCSQEGIEEEVVLPDTVVETKNPNIDGPLKLEGFADASQVE